jgi:AraC family transcriptional regulator of adaptative response/methylated-DNA-[protein]-cysteine methyltransferase
MQNTFSFFSNLLKSDFNLNTELAQFQIRRWENGQNEIQPLNYYFFTHHSEKYIVVATSRGICFFGYVDNEETTLADIQNRFQGIRLKELNSKSDILQFIEMLKSPNQIQISFVLDLYATDFQWRVWMELLKIPRGKTKSYGDLALDLQLPKTASRAVGTAIGQNPIAVFIPCHRVVQQNGKLGGYRWGLERKRKLLVAEQESR